MLNGLDGMTYAKCFHTDKPISFCDEIAGSADEGIAADVFLPDISEALDFVFHSILINKSMK